MLLLFVCMKVENIRILFTHQDNWEQPQKLLPEGSFYLLSLKRVNNYNFQLDIIDVFN